jgi:DNA replicative helicase MCM subunit Mcm2 (Cdc46/Mcm family)
MELVEICFKGSESYPNDEPPPGKPPPQKRTLSQQERLQLIIALIIENQDNSRGASIEMVVSSAAVRGIEREQVLNDIQHLKFKGYVYEPKIGEIRYAL